MIKLLERESLSNNLICHMSIVHKDMFRPFKLEIAKALLQPNDETSYVYTLPPLPP